MNNIYLEGNQQTLGISSDLQESSTAAGVLEEFGSPSPSLGSGGKTRNAAILDLVGFVETCFLLGSCRPWKPEEPCCQVSALRVSL